MCGSGGYGRICLVLYIWENILDGISLLQEYILDSIIKSGQIIFCGLFGERIRDNA